MNYKKLLLSITLLLIFTVRAFASDIDTAILQTIYSYKYTITKIEISKDGGQTFTEVFSGSTEFSLGASTESSDQKKGTLCENVYIPAGIYNYLRITVASTGRISWTATFGNGETYSLHSDGYVYEDSNPSEADVTWDTALYEGTMPDIEFTNGYKRTVRIYSDIGSATIYSNLGHTLFGFSVEERVVIGDLEESLASYEGATSIFNFTITSHCPIKE